VELTGGRALLSGGGAVLALRGSEVLEPLWLSYLSISGDARQLCLSG